MIWNLTIWHFVKWNLIIWNYIMSYGKVYDAGCMIWKFVIWYGIVGPGQENILIWHVWKNRQNFLGMWPRRDWKLSSHLFLVAICQEISCILNSCSQAPDPSFSGAHQEVAEAFFKSETLSKVRVCNFCLCDWRGNRGTPGRSRYITYYYVLYVFPNLKLCQKSHKTGWSVSVNLLFLCFVHPLTSCWPHNHQSMARSNGVDELHNLDACGVSRLSWKVWLPSHHISHW